MWFSWVLVGFKEERIWVGLDAHGVNNVKVKICEECGVQSIYGNGFSSEV